MYHKTKDSVTFNSQVQFWCKLSIGVIIFILLLTSAILQIIRNPKCFQSLLGKSSYNEGSTNQNWSGSDRVPWCGMISDQLVAIYSLAKTDELYFRTYWYPIYRIVFLVGSIPNKNSTNTFWIDCSSINGSYLLPISDWKRCHPISCFSRSKRSQLFTGWC